MKIEPKSIKVKDIFDGYADNGDNGVFAYDGRLAIRPAYQREFVYSSEQAESVIHTILKGFPLNVMYWVKVGDDQYEVLDGQQRTLSVMQYLDHKYSISVDGGKYYVLRGQRRGRNEVNARQIAMYLIRRMTNLSLNDIGKEFGDRDHTTVLHSLDKVEKQMRTDPAFAEVVKEITTNINAKR